MTPTLHSGSFTDEERTKFVLLISQPLNEPLVKLLQTVEVWQDHLNQQASGDSFSSAV